MANLILTDTTCSGANGKICFQIPTEHISVVETTLQESQCIKPVWQHLCPLSLCPKQRALVESQEFQILVMAFHTRARGMISVPGQTPIKTDTVLFTHLKVSGPENCPNLFGVEKSRSQDKRCQSFCLHRKHSCIILSYGKYSQR